MKTFEITKDDETIKLAVLPPTEKQLQDAEAKRINTISRLIKTGGKDLLSRVELEEFLRDNNIWSDKDEEKVQNLNEEIDELLSKLKKGGISVKEGRDICIYITEKRIEMLRTIAKRQSYDNATIESQAEQKRDEYLTYVCTVKEDDSELYWDSFDEFLEDAGSEAYNGAVKRAMDYLAGEDETFEKRLPENRWLKKYGYLNDQLQYIDRKTGERVDKNGDPIDESADFVRSINNLQGEIVEEEPFVDEETGEPITFEKTVD